MNFFRSGLQNQEKTGQSYPNIEAAIQTNCLAWVLGVRMRKIHRILILNPDSELWDSICIILTITDLARQQRNLARILSIRDVCLLVYIYC